MKVLKIVFGFLVLGVIAVVGFSYWMFSSLNAPHTHDKSNQFIKIEKGTPPREIIANLAAEGILASELSTLIYVRTVGDSSKLQAGDYQFVSPVTPLQVLKISKKARL